MVLENKNFILALTLDINFILSFRTD